MTTTDLIGLPDLFRLRRRLADLRAAARILHEQEMDNLTVSAEVTRLSSQVVTVALTCLICKSTVPHRVLVDATSVPRTAVCGLCAGMAGEDDDPIIAN